MYTIAEKLTNSGEKVSSFSVKLTTLAAAGLLLAGCAGASGVAKTPRMSERNLRPMNQELGAWLARINAVPAPSIRSDRDQTVSAAQPLAEGHSSEGALILTAALPPQPLQPALSPSSAPSPTASSAKPPATDSTRPVSTPSAGAVAAEDPTSSNAGKPRSDPAAKAAGAGDGAALAAKPNAAAVPGGTAGNVTGTTPTPPVATEVVKPAAKEIWLAENGSSFRTTLTAWASKAGWAEPRWDASVDYPIAGTMTFEGDFLDAVRGIFKAHAGVQRPVQADIYVSQKFIHVTE